MKHFQILLGSNPEAALVKEVGLHHIFVTGDHSKNHNLGVHHCWHIIWILAMPPIIPPVDLLVLIKVFFIFFRRIAGGPVFPSSSTSSATTLHWSSVFLSCCCRSWPLSWGHRTCMEDPMNRPISQPERNSQLLGQDIHQFTGIFVNQFPDLNNKFWLCLNA